MGIVRYEWWSLGLRAQLDGKLRKMPVR